MTAVTLTVGADAWVDSVNSSEDNPAGPYLRVVAPGTRTRYVFIHVKLPTPVLKGATVLSATLKLYEVDAPGGAAKSVTVQRADGAWSETRVNWNNKPGVVGTTVTVAQTADAAAKEWAFDVTPHLQTMSGGATNWGWRISTTSTGELKFWSFDAGKYRPVLVVEYSDAPDKPTELSPAGGSAVTVAKPVLSLNFHDVAGSTQMGALQVQINGTNDFTAPAFDSGTVVTTDPELDLSTTTYAGIAVGGTAWWRTRVQDAAGIWSKWSDAVSFTRTARGVLTITSPTGGVINDPTQPITWNLAGAAQTGWQVDAWDMDNDPARSITIAGTALGKRRAGTANSFALPKGVITKEGTNYRVRVRAWDIPTRVATPGDPVHTEQVADFVFAGDATIIEVTNLTAAQAQGAQPPVKLGWKRATAPDGWSIWDNGVLLAHDVDIVADGAGFYWFTDYKAAPRISHTYRVRPKVNGKLSVGATVDYSYQLPDVWLADASEGHLVPVNGKGGNDVITWNAPQAGSSVLVKNGKNVVRVYQSQMGLQGTIQGLLIDGHGGSATTWTKNMEWLRDRPKNKFRLIVGRMSFNVVLSDVVVSPYRYGDNPDESEVSCSFWSQGEDW